MSKFWVGAIVAVFVLILAYGLLFGKAGLLSHRRHAEEPAPDRHAGTEHHGGPSTSPSALAEHHARCRARPVGPTEHVPGTGAASTAPSATPGTVAPASRNAAPVCAAGGGTRPATGPRASSSSAASRDPHVLARDARRAARPFRSRLKLQRPAYDDGALPIGHGQTISQPYIVASMTQALVLSEWSAAHDGAQPKVLDVGTGSGYQAAVLAEMGARRRLDRARAGAGGRRGARA